MKKNNNKKNKPAAKAAKASKQGPRKRVNTGISGLDKLVGGFKEGSVNLIIGGAGSCKTIMAMQFIIEGIKRGEKGIYMTFEEKKERTFDDMRSFGWNLEKYEESGELSFLEYTPEQVRKIISEGGGEIESLIEKTKAKRLVIDSMTSFALLYKDELARKEAALFLFELIHKWQCTALLTDQTLEEGKLFSQLGFEVDSIIILYHIRAKGIRKRGLEILKMRGTKIPQKTFPFEVGSRGILLNTGGVLDW